MEHVHLPFLQTIITCRNCGGAGDEAHLERARDLVLLAEVHGATLVAWGADAASFAWGQDQLDGAVGFLASLRDSEAGGAPWGIGIAEGALTRLGESGRRAELAWGPALGVASALSTASGEAEVLAETSLELLRLGGLVTAPPPVEVLPGLLALRVTGIVERRSMLPEQESAPLVDVDDIIESTRTIPAPPKRPSAPPPPVRPSPKGALTQTAARLIGEAGGEGAGSVSALRRAREQSANSAPGVRCQLSLALAIALANAGRHEDALLDGLDALARAVEAADRRAVTASRAFLSKLFTSVGRYADADRIRPSVAADE